MRWTQRFALRYRSWFRRGAIEHDLDVELQFHLEQQTRENLAAGMNSADARSAAICALGSTALAKDQCRDSLGLRLLDEIRQDTRYAARTLLRNPGFTLVAVLTLALGIGANTAVFSAVVSVLIKTPALPDPDRFVSIRETDSRTPGFAGPVSSGNFMDWKDHVPAFETIAAWTFQYFNVAGRGEPEQVQGYEVSASYLPLVGARTATGRLFLPDEEQPGHERVTVVSHAFWRRRFGAAPDLVGQTIAIDGQPFTVVGILADTFATGRVLNRPIDLYVPLVLTTRQMDRRSHDLNVNARLAVGVTLDQAQAQLDDTYRHLATAAADATMGVRVFSLVDTIRRGSRPVLLLVMAAVGTVLLIACANITNLLLARAAVGQPEMALRTALGAARSRIIRQLLTESVLLALLGGVAGLLAAVGGIHILAGVVSFDVVRSMETSILDGRVFAFSVGLSMACGVACGLAPAWQSARSLHETLANAGRGTVRAGLRVRPAGRLFVVAQLTLAVALSSGALLLVRSALILQGLPRGLSLHNVLTMQIWLPRVRYPDGVQTARFFDAVLERVNHIPGVESGSVINFPPLAPQDTGVALRIEGRGSAMPDESLYARYSVIDRQYFRTMQIPVLAGRVFVDSDADEAHGVAIVSAAMAHRFWPTSDPIGQRIQPQFTGEQHFWDAGFKNLPLTIVGVVGDVRDDGPALQGRDDVPHFYLPYRQNPASLMHLMIRTRSNPVDVVPAVRRTVWAVDPSQPVFDIKTMEDVTAETFGQPRVMANLTGTFAVAALLLAAVGVYGLFSYIVSQSTRDIGVRMALGARSQDVLQAILREGVQLGFVGVAVGLAASFGLTRLLAGFLFGVGAADPLTFASVAALLFTVTLAACFIPAYRAMRVDPMAALRAE